MSAAKKARNPAPIAGWGAGEIDFSDAELQRIGQLCQLEGLTREKFLERCVRERLVELAALPRQAGLLAKDKPADPFLRAVDGFNSARILETAKWFEGGAHSDQEVAVRILPHNPDHAQVLTALADMKMSWASKLRVKCSGINKGLN